MDYLLCGHTWLRTYSKTTTWNVCKNLEILFYVDISSGSVHQEETEIVFSMGFEFGVDTGQSILMMLFCNVRTVQILLWCCPTCYAR